MTPLQEAAVFAAGIGAGTINTIVGSGTLLTFPVLLAVGFSPVVANVSNTVGLVFGSVSGAWGYRSELEGQRDRILRLAVVATVGGVLGGVLLLALPPDAFKVVVPVLIGAACVLVVAQPAIGQRLAARRDAASTSERGGLAVRAGVLAAAVYGGYFGAAMGVLFIAVLAIFLGVGMQRANAMKNVLAAFVNLTDAVLFILLTHVDWMAAGLIGVGSMLGGMLGARVGRRLQPSVLRGVVVVVGLVALVKIVSG